MRCPSLEATASLGQIGRLLTFVICQPAPCASASCLRTRKRLRAGVQAPIVVLEERRASGCSRSSARPERVQPIRQVLQRTEPVWEHVPDPGASAGSAGHVIADLHRIVPRADPARLPGARIRLHHDLAIEHSSRRIAKLVPVDCSVTAAPKRSQVAVKLSARYGCRKPACVWVS